MGPAAALDPIAVALHDHPPNTSLAGGFHQVVEALGPLTVRQLELMVKVLEVSEPRETRHLMAEDVRLGLQHSRTDRGAVQSIRHHRLSAEGLHSSRSLRGMGQPMTW